MTFYGAWQTLMALPLWEMILVSPLILIVVILTLAVIAWFITIIYTGISVEVDEHFIRPLAKCEHEHREVWRLKDITPTASWYECPICHRERFGGYLGG